MLSVFQLGRFCSPFKIAGTRVIGGFGILRRSAQCTRRPNLKAARKKKLLSSQIRKLKLKFCIAFKLNCLLFGSFNSRWVSGKAFVLSSVLTVQHFTPLGRFYTHVFRVIPSIFFCCLKSAIVTRYIWHFQGSGVHFVSFKRIAITFLTQPTHAEGSAA